MARVRIEAIEKRFTGATTSVSVLAGLSLEVADGSCVAILGPSGCGKTTLLRIVAGLERPDSGRVFFDARDMTTVAPERRGIGMVFQNDALFPHRSARENIAYGLEGRGLSRAVVAARTLAVARRLRIEALLERPARVLSGGERQRVAVARALAPEPAVLLLDEPFSRLDAPLRAELRRELGTTLRAGRETALFVTHDQGEAMALADRIAVVRAGVIEQLATPRVLYDAPATAYVAGFVGSPAMSFVPAAALGFGRAVSGAVTLGFRPEAIRVVGAGEGDVAGVVRLVENLGAVAYAYVDTSLGLLTAAVREPLPPTGGNLSLAFDRTQAHAFDASGASLRESARV